MLNIHRLRLLRELQLRGTVSSVAEVLNYSPSAVSQQLSLLEREVGVPLLEQVGRRLRLTTAGEILCEHTTLVLRQLEAAQADVSRTREQLSGTLRAAAFQTATLRLVPSLLSQLKDDHPDLRVIISEIQPDDALSALSAYDFDLIVGEEYPGIPLPRDEGIHRLDLSDDQMLLVAANGRWPDRARLADFADASWIMEPPGNAARQWAESVCRAAGFEPDVQFESSDLIAHLRLANTGHAVAFLPKLLCEEMHPDNVRLIGLPNKDARVIYTAVRKGAEIRPDLVAFRQALATAHEQRSSSPALS